MQVLVVDDDADIREIVRLAFDHLPESKEFDVVEAANASEALSAVSTMPIDVVVMDLGLPDMAGLDLLQRLHAHDKEIRVLVLTGSVSESDRIDGLVGGADDYVQKPFSPGELAARVVALARRRPQPAPTVVAFGDLRVDTIAREVTRAGDAIEMTRREFDLLAFLVTHPRQSFSRDELLQGAFTSSSQWQSTATITEHMRRLRLKLEVDGSQTHLVTVRGLGYRFEPGDTEAGLLESHARSSLEATFVTVGHRIVYASDAALAMMGLRDQDDVVGRDPFDFVAPASAEAAETRRRSIGKGRWPRPEVLLLCRPDGTELFVELSSTPVLWEGKAAIQVTLWEPQGEGRSSPRPT